MNELTENDERNIEFISRICEQRMSAQLPSVREALNRLELEVIHYRNTGIGKQFLIAAIEHLLDVMQVDKPQPDTDMKTRQIKRLSCSVCGETTKGRQWYNRDTGFGICPKCVDWVASKGETPEEIKSNYGVRGVHYAVGVSRCK